MPRELSNKIIFLNQTALETLNAPSEKVIIQKFVTAGLTVLGADFGYAWFKGPKAKKLALLYKSPSMPYVPAYPRPQGMMHRAIHGRASQFITKLAKDKRVLSDAKGYMKSAVVIPLNYMNTTYGVLVLGFKSTRTFSFQDRALSGFLGNSAAQAITINRLYSNLKNFKNTLDGTFDSIFMFNPETYKVEYVNQGGARQLGVPRSQMYKKTLFELQTTYAAEDAPGLLSLLLSSPTNSHLFETQLVCADEKKVPVEFFLQYVKAQNQPPKLMSIVRDISERKKAEEIMYFYAYYDSLTNLPNRAFFTEQLTKALEDAKAKKQELAIMFVDLDRFKFINDVLGHIVGDKVLTQVAKRLESCLRPTDVISRFGGDEFIIFLPNMADGYDGIQAAKRLQEVFSAPFEIDGDEIFINISIGLSRYPSDGKNIVSLLNAADSALQRAKEHGGNNFQQYHSGIVVPHQMHLKLEKQLRKALERGELELHFQPQVTIDGSKVVGCEALVRWNHPELGLMYPDQFISYAEDSGLIIPMGEWVLRDACKSAKQLLDKGSPSFTISVNVSPRQLLQYNLVETVSTILRETGLPAKYLELEITERILMKNIDISIEILTQLKKMGIKISIDDFGTGYASLSYLRKLPVNKIKIDRSFIHGSLKNVQDAAIITAIITIAHQLNLEVIAEGVETKKQLAFLQKNSCDYMQGNLFSKPLSQKEFSALLGKKRKVKKTKAR